MNDTLFAYLAGAMDSDGWFGIKRSTYHQRVRGDAGNPVYSERLGLKQVTPEIPHLLHETFGGRLSQDKGLSDNSRPLHSYQCTDKRAAEACRALLPYLRVKRRQAEVLLELRRTKDSAYWQPAHWFLQEHPNWRELDMVTTSEAARILGYTSRESVSQAIRNGTLLALPWDHAGKETPRIPRLLVEQLAVNLSKDGRARNRPEQLIAWRERLCQEVRELNKNGVTGTPIYHRTGCFEPAE